MTRSRPAWIAPVHELAICESILTQVLAIADVHGGCQVGRISLKIGPLSGVEPHLLLRAFPLVAAGTQCEAAIVEIEEIAVRVACRLCGAVSGAKSNRLLCGECGTWQVTLVNGDEMLLERVELLDTSSNRNKEHADV
jgi:hydrogenase nickel incorporation protein HypA/HybF